MYIPTFIKSSSQWRMARASMMRRNATLNPVSLPLRFQSMLLSNTLLGEGLLLVVYPIFSSILCLPLTLLLTLLSRLVGSLLDPPLLLLNLVSDLSSVLYNHLLLVLGALLQIRLLRCGGHREYGARIGLLGVRLRSS